MDRYAFPATTARRTNRTSSKPHRHSEMASRKSEPRIEPLRIDAGVVREQLHQLAPLGARFRDRPLHHLLADAAAAAMAGDADVLDQGARGALRAEPRQDAEMQAADHDGVTARGHAELDIEISIDRLERREIGRRQRLFEPLARA